MSTIAADFYQTPAHRELVEAVRADDHVRQSAIVEAEIARLQGAERALWLCVRAGRRLRQNVLLPGPTWADLEEALRIGGHDELVQASVLQEALNFGLLHERMGCIWLYIRSLPNLRQLLHEPNTRGNLGLLALRRGRWGAAFRQLNVFERGFRQLPEEIQVAYRGLLRGMIARRAVAAFASGRPEQGMRDVQTVEEMLASAVTLATVSAESVALARAERAFYRRDFQEAKAALQWGAVQGASGKYYRERVSTKVEMELMGARIARAEGNAAAFAHFCARAEQLLQYHDLPLTRARIEAIKAGAPR